MPSVVKVVAVTQDDPFFTGRFFESFLRESERHPVELVEVVLLRNFNESKPALALRLLKMYGLVDLVRLLCRYASAKLAERRGQPRSVAAVAARHRVSVRRLPTINDEVYLRTLRDRQIDVLLSVAAPEIFRAPALRAVPYVLNVHSGRLPQYRGMMPTFWALHNGEQEVVVTVHEMAERLDTGGVLAEFPVPVAPAESAFEVSAKAKVVAGREVARLLSLIRTDAWPEARPLDLTKQSYYRFPTRRAARRLRALGRRLL